MLIHQQFPNFGELMQFLDGWWDQMDLDESALNAEIDRISLRIDEIMEKVNRFYPQQELKPSEGRNTAKSNDDKAGLP